MKDILIVNMSPRPKGTSTMLAGMCADSLGKSGRRIRQMNLYQEMKDPGKLCDAVGEAGTLILSGPCYINTYPADVTAFLKELESRPEVLSGQSLYGIIQGGMPYVHTHEGGLNMLRIFAKKCNLNYRGGFVMGMGAMLNGGPLDRLFNAKKVKRQLDVFLNHIENDEPSPRQTYLDAQMKMPVLLYRILAIAANRAIDKEQRKNTLGAKKG